MAGKTDKSKKVEYRWFIGGLAGSVASAATHPLDLLKVRLQVAKELVFKKAGNDQKVFASLLRKEASINGIVKGIFKKERVIGFYRGLSASILRQLTYSSMRFNTYFVLKAKIMEILAFIGQLASAIGAGTVAAVAGNTFDVLNIRMQSDAGLPLEQRRRYRHAIDGLLRVLKTEGVSGCMTGLPTNIQRAIVITIAQFISYERAKGLLLRNGFADGLSTHFASSMISGLVTVTLSNPVDVVKSVLMSSPHGKKLSGLSCALQLLKSHGPLYFMKGWGPAYVRLGPHTVITFIILEQLKKFPLLQKSNK